MEDRDAWGREDEAKSLQWWWVERKGRMPARQNRQEDEWFPGSWVPRDKGGQVGCTCPIVLFHRALV